MRALRVVGSVREEVAQKVEMLATAIAVKIRRCEDNEAVDLLSLLVGAVIKLGSMERTAER